MSNKSKFSEFISARFVWLILLALVIGVFLRFFTLGSNTLNDPEAIQALQALNIVREEPTTIGSQPGYIGLTSFIFYLFQGSDFFARFWPAVFGSILILVPCLFRKELDDLPTVVLSFLVSFEPGLVALSRTADGTMIMLASMIGAFGLLKNRKMIAAGFLIGLSISASSYFWPLVISLALAYLAWGMFGGFSEKIGSEFHKRDWLKMIFACVISVIIVTTLLFTQPIVFSGLGSGIVEYIRSWRQPETTSVLSMLLSWLILQFPALILGIWGLVQGFREKSNFNRFLGIWWLFGLVLTLINPSHKVWDIVLADIPLFVLAGIQIARVIQSFEIRSNVVVSIEGIVTIALIVFSIINFMNLVNFPTSDTVMMRNRLLGTLLPLIMWVAFSALLGWGWDVPSTKSGLLIGLGVLFFGLLMSSGWKAASLGNQPQNEIFTSGATITGAQDLQQTVEDIARWNNGVKNRIDIDLVGIESPSLLWFFRDYERITQNKAFPVSQTPSMVISGMDSIIQSHTAYRGQAFEWNRQPDLEHLQWQDWAKWFFNRNIPTVKENLILWVRNDLFKDIAIQQQ